MSSKENGADFKGPDPKDDNWFTQHIKQIAAAVVVLVILAAGGGAGAFFYIRGQKGNATQSKVDCKTSGNMCIGRKRPNASDQTLTLRLRLPRLCKCIKQIHRCTKDMSLYSLMYWHPNSYFCAPILF